MASMARPAGWWQPDGSGATVGIKVSKASWGFSKKAYIPAPTIKKSAYLKYTWDTSESSHLIREYLPPTEDKNIEFDSTMTMQAYVYGDGSGTLFRFAVDEFYDGGWKDTEVSLWVTVDWIGWRLVEWKLTEPGTVGSWISPNEEITGDKFRMDSFQFSYVPDVSAESGLIYIDEFRVVQKTDAQVGIHNGNTTPEDFTLRQNYPNPFNPQTTISYTLPRTSRVVLSIYSMTGQRVKTLVNELQNAGRYNVRFDGSSLASGSYIYRLEAGGKILSKKMLLVK